MRHRVVGRRGLDEGDVAERPQLTVQSPVKYPEAAYAELAAKLNVTLMSEAASQTHEELVSVIGSGTTLQEVVDLLLANNLTTGGCKSKSKLLTKLLDQAICRDLD